MNYIKTLIPFGGGGNQINIEIDSNRGLPGIDIIGLPDNAIKESKERLRAAFRHCDVEIPPHKFIINLAPSDIKKNGTICDLAIATSLFCHITQQHITQQAQTILDKSLIFGELGLDGGIKASQGIFAGVIAGMKMGYTNFIIPKECEEQCKYFENINVYIVDHFSQIVHFCLGKISLPQSEQKLFSQSTMYSKNLTNISFDEIQGHTVAKRALAIAVAGRHNVLLVGSPGGGKSILAKATRNLLPPMGFDEIVEVSYLYSLAGLLTSQQPLVTHRSFRSIHSSSSKASIIGGGNNAQPGEISLAHKGVLFLDEIGEFPRDILDSLRQPLEEKQIHISRVWGKATYPAECMFIGATNPCICGYYEDPYHTCRCTITSVKRYQSKISGPLLDRMDLILQIENQESGFNEKITNTKNDSEESMQARIQQALERQHNRYKNTSYQTNAQVAIKDIHQFMPLSGECEELLQQAIKILHYSLRVIHKTIRVARSIADYDGVDNIKKEHIAEALSYRAQNWIVKE